MTPSAATPPLALTDVLVAGFGATVAMWGVGYVARLPVVGAPAPVVLVALLGVLVVSGFAAGWCGTRGVRGGLYAGAVTGVLNLLVLGSFLSTSDRTNALLPSAVLWIPGSIAISSGLAAAGAWLGAMRPRRARAIDFTHAFACVTVAATLLLLVAGGLVTSKRAGLAVVDWPNSYGYNMFLYPFARMTGGIYYEHAHRLLGALVGLTTMTLAAVLASNESRGWVKRGGFVAVGLVVAQGVLGGMRVTGKPTLSTDPAFTEPNVYLAVVHGVVAQVFFSLVVALAVVTSPSWRSGDPPRAVPGARGERMLANVALTLVVVQIAFGAIQRHLAMGLMLHITMAILVAGHTIACGTRTWGLHGEDRILRRAGLAVVHATIAQFTLGVVAWVVRGAYESGTLSEGWKVFATTVHQGMGAILLASVVALRLWLSRRLTAPAR